MKAVPANAPQRGCAGGDAHAEAIYELAAEPAGDEREQGAGGREHGGRHPGVFRHAPAQPPRPEEEQQHDDVAQPVQQPHAPRPGILWDREPVDPARGRCQHSADEAGSDHVVGHKRCGAAVVCEAGDKVEHDGGGEQAQREDDQDLVERMPEHLDAAFHIAYGIDALVQFDLRLCSTGGALITARLPNGGFTRTHGGRGIS
jgi:hypothetical protein